MSTVRELWGAASVLMDYWNRLSDDREEVSEDEFVSRMAALPDGTRTDMELVVLGMHSLKEALATFDPDQWANEAKTQAVIGVYALRVTQEVARAQRAEAALDEIRKISWKNGELNVHRQIGDCESAFEQIVDVLNEAAKARP